MNHYVYEQLSVGQKEGFSVVVTEDMMDRFREITGDINPLHSENDFAISHNYRQRVVYGMLTASFLSTLAGVYLPGELSLIQSVETKFLKPVFVGDIIFISGVVAELNDSVRQIVLKVVMTNQAGEKVLKGTMKIGVLS